MFSKLVKVTFFGCIVIAASVPAEAGLFDRILNRNGGRKAGCCQPQVVCTPAPCAPARCAPTACAPTACAPTACAPTSSAPCTRAPTCLEQYQKNLKTCEKLFGNNPQTCQECKRIAQLAYCECINDPSGKGMSLLGSLSVPKMQIICILPTDPTPEICHYLYEQCVADGGTNCARCFFQCNDLCLSQIEVP